MASRKVRFLIAVYRETCIDIAMIRSWTPKHVREFMMGELRTPGQTHGMYSEAYARSTHQGCELRDSEPIT